MSDLVPDRPRRLRDSRAAGLARQETPVSRLLAEYALPHNGRMGRTDAMMALLKAMVNHTEAADRFRRHLADALASTGLCLDGADMTQLVTHECHSAFFRKLRARGYCETTTWGGLAEILPELWQEAMAAALMPPLVPDEAADGILTVKQQRLSEGARAFLQAADPCMAFLRDPDAQEIEAAPGA